MRQLTAYASYHDNLGELLVGRARFYNMDGSPASVYGWNNSTHAYISLGASVFTNSSGQLDPQVFLADHDYLVFFDKYTGDGTMAEDDDPESWEEQGSAIDRYNIIGVELTAESLRTIDTISELRTTEALADGEIVLLLGYEETGDKDPIMYKWDGFATDDDNGGSCIAVTGTERGRWRFTECPKVLDVRHFGVFPRVSIADDPTQRYKIQLAGAYAHVHNAGLYFPASSEAMRYDITGLTLYDVDCNKSARLYSVSGTSTYIRGIKQVYCDSNEIGMGSIRLIDDVVRSSWEGNSHYVSLEPTRKLILDSEIQRSGSAAAWSGIEVEIQVYNDVELDSCFITSNRKISGPITIRNTELKTSWFIDYYDFETNLTSDDNTILLKNCDTAQQYMTLKTMQGESNYGDLAGGYITNFPVPAAVVELSNCSGSIVVGNTGLTNLRLKNVNLVIVTPETDPSSTLPDMVVENSALTFSGGNNYSSIIARRTAISGSTPVNITGSVYLDDCDTEVAIAINGACVMKECTIGANVVQTFGGVIDLILLGNMFNAQFTIGGTTANTVLHAIISNNHSTASNPINLVRSLLDPDDSHHQYSYEGNTGAFVSNSTQQTIKNVKVYYRELGPEIVGETPEITDPLTLRRFYQTGMMYVLQTDGHYFDTLPFFRIGTTSFDVTMEFLLSYGNAADGIYLPVLMTATHVSGNTWKLAPKRLPDDSDYAIYPVVATGMPTSESRPTPDNYTGTYIIRYTPVG